MANEEKKDLTGLEFIPEEEKRAKNFNPKDNEYNLTEALLKAAEFRTIEENLATVDIVMGGQKLFTLTLHPISDTDSRKCRKKATKYMPNPNGRKLPPIEKDFDSAKFHSLIIYEASTPDCQREIWGNKEVMDKYDILDPVDCVDLLIPVGKKLEIVDTIMEISGLDEEDASPEDYAKN